MVEKTPNSSPNSTAHDASASRKRQRGSESAEAETPTKVPKSDRTPVFDQKKDPSKTSTKNPGDHARLETGDRGDARQDVQDPKMREQAEQRSNILATAMLKDSSSEQLTRGGARIVLVRDGVFEVVAVLPDSNLMQLFDAAANNVRTYRQASARAALQKQRLRSFRMHKLELSDNIRELAGQHESVSDRLTSLYWTLQDEIGGADDAETEIEDRLAKQRQEARYRASAVAGALKTLFEECKYFQEATELGDVSKWDEEFDQKFALPNSNLDIGEKIEDILKEHSIEIPKESGSPDAATQGADSNREQDDEAEYQFDPEIEARRTARIEYSQACSDYADAQEALEDYKESFARALRHQKDNDEIQENASINASHQYFHEVQRLTAAIRAAEEKWIGARKHAESLGIDVGFDEHGFDYTWDDDRESVRSPGDFPEPRHNPKFEPGKWWHDALPRHAVTRTMTRQDDEKSSPDDVSIKTDEEGFGAGFSAIEDCPHKAYLIREWAAHCEKLRTEFEHQS